MSRTLRRTASTRRLPRALHPGAWWLWAGGLVTAASRTTNPILLLLIVAVAGYVVAARRTDAPWARAFRYYLMFGLVVIGLRVVLRCIFGGGGGSTHVLARLPEVPLPHWAAGVQIGGPVTAEGTLAATYDGLRLAVLLCCVGAANALANPKRALRVLPGALYELGMAVVVAVSVAPQLVESTQRVVRARRLRGSAHRGFHALHSVIIPVLHDALDRALLLAAAMDSRGYGRRAAVPAGARRATAGLLVAGLLGLCVGAYGLLGDSTAPGVALPGLLIGGALCILGLALGSRRVRHTDYRPDRWGIPEWLVVASGVTTAAVLVVASHLDVAHVTPAVSPLGYPPVPWLPVLGILIGATPALVAPPPVIEGREKCLFADSSASCVVPREQAGAAA